MKARKEKRNEVKRPAPPAKFDDNPAWTLKDLRRARPAREIVPKLVEAARRGRGRPPIEKPKVPLTLRLDPDAIEAFRKTGPGWQSRINATLVRAAKKLRSVS